MLTYRLRHSAALVLMVTQLVGCYHWVESPTGVGALVQDSVTAVRLTLRDETRFEVPQPTVVGDSIRGSGWGTVTGDDGSVEGATAIEDVEIVEVFQVNGGATAVMVTSLLLVGVLVIVGSQVEIKSFGGAWQN